MSRTVILLGLTQISVVVLGFFGLGIIMRHFGYPDEPHLPGGLGVYHWSHLGLFLRHDGLALLVAPIFWTVFTAISDVRAKFILPLGLWLALGTIIPFVTIMTFLYVIVHPFVFVTTP